MGDGTFLIGADIEPGQYKTTVPPETDLACMWHRLRGTGGTRAEKIETGFERPGADAFVTIQPGDKAFDSLDCGTWTKVG